MIKKANAKNKAILIQRETQNEDKEVRQQVRYAY